MAESGPILEFGGAVPLQREKSYHSNIMFMQQEHTKTLQALHDEIQRLQKKCSELTFSVAMGTTSSPQEDFYREKTETLQKDLNEKIKALKLAYSSIEEKDKRISDLELKNRAQEKKFKDKIALQEQELRQLRTEISDKSALNAELMLKRLSQSQESSAAMFRVTKTGIPHNEPDLSASYPVRTAANYPEDSPRDAALGSPKASRYPIAPHPPREGSGQRTRRRTSPRTMPLEGEPVLSAKVRPQRAPSGRALRRSSGTPEAIPDPTPFLNRHHHQEEIDTHPTKFETPLPPINPRGGYSGVGRVESSQAGYRDNVHADRASNQAYIAKSYLERRNRTTVATTRDGSSGSSSPEVEVLAVHAHKRQHKLRQAQEYNTDYK